MSPVEYLPDSPRIRILFLSEIKWGYLRTRKQQILRRFPKEWDILYIEPIVARGRNSYRVRRDGNIRHVTVPYFKNFPQKWIRSLFAGVFFRRIYTIISMLWLRVVLFGSRMTSPDIILVSNIYYGEIVRNHFRDALVVYDCNDNHLSFPFTPPWASVYSHNLQERADCIVCSSTALTDCIEPRYRNKVRIIGNGVDMELFDKSRLGDLDILSGYPRPRLLYLGALSEWIDYDLLDQIARTYTSGSLILIGPVARPVQTRFDELVQRTNVHHLGVVDHSRAGAYMAAADVCLIPFQKNELTIRVNPNKVYEYLAMGCPVVSIDISPEVRALGDHIYLAENADSFIQLIGEAITRNRRASEWSRVASKHDWRFKAAEYEDLLRTMRVPKSENSTDI